MASSGKPLIFISYSHRDEKWLDYVREHLRTAEFGGEIALWDDRRMTGGADWQAEIKGSLEGCRVCILLVSRFSLTSNYINRVEMRTVLERAKSEGVCVYPIVVTGAHIPEDHWLWDFNLRPRDGKPLKTISNSTGKRDTVMVAIVGEVVKLAGASAPPPAASSTAHPAIVDTSALPETALVRLRGREKELGDLDRAWDDPNIHVFSVVAWGGQGKSALATHWVDGLKAAGGRGATAILAWSFYSQGTKERATSADGFFDWALKILGIADPGASATARAEALAAHLRRQRLLLILDGVEPLQHGPGPQEGQLKDPALRVLLRRVADRGANGGLVLVTTRLEVKDIERWKSNAAPLLDLRQLTDEAGAELLADHKVAGPAKELGKAAHEFGGHALALTLLASFLTELHGGDIFRRDRVRGLLSDAEIAQHDHAVRVIEAYDKEWLAPIEGASFEESARRALMRSVMFMAGLFDRPATANCIAALRAKPAISGFSDELVAASDTAYAHAVNRLRRASLLLPTDAREPGGLDAHPLVREWFGDGLWQTNEAGWRQAHGRLYEHLRDSTKEGDDPKLPALEPLFQAIPHGCKAGRQQETLVDVYRNRICRRWPDGDIAYHASKKLGAIGPSISALAWFFDVPFEAPHAGLTTMDGSWVLGQAGYYLGVLGRFSEALGAQRGPLDISVAAKDWLNAAVRASNLAEVELALGQVAEAKLSAAQSVDAADRDGDDNWMIASRATLAAALTAAGERVAASALFADAELRKTRWEPEYPHLYGFEGYRYCDLLLGDCTFADVTERAAYGLEFSVGENLVLIVGLDSVSLGRAALGLALSAGKPAESKSQMREARTRLDASVAELGRSNFAQYQPIGLLARARYFRAVGDFSASRRDLDEVEEIAAPGPMRLHLCDMWIERCRSALAAREGFAPLGRSPPAPAPADLATTARNALAEAAKLIATCGYHRRDAERDELREVLSGRRPFRDLPPRV